MFINVYLRSVPVSWYHRRNFTICILLLNLIDALCSVTYVLIKLICSVVGGIPDVFSICSHSQSVEIPRSDDLISTYVTLLSVSIKFNYKIHIANITTILVDIVDIGYII